jgi:hypothetical protein
MNAKRWLILAGLLALLVLAIATACQSTRSDAQIQADVQSKISSDPAVQSRQFAVQSSNGVITLSGNVASDAERVAVASDAAQIKGVRTVVNNLQLTPPPAETAAAPSPASEPAPAPARRERISQSRMRNEKPSGFHAPTAAKGNNGPVKDYSSPAPTVAANTPPVAPPPPPAPPKPVTVTVPEGTTIAVRLIDPIDSERNQPGDRFRATLDNSIVVNDHVVIPSGADIYGRVSNVKSAAHFSGRSQLALELTSLSFNGKSYELHTDQYSRQGTARGKNTAAKVGGGAALGAIIGGIAGGGKGAAIGGAIGAGAGTGAQAVTHGEQIRLTSETPLSFHLERPVTVTPSARNEHNASRQKLDKQDKQEPID